MRLRDGSRLGFHAENEVNFGGDSIENGRGLAALLKLVFLVFRPLLAIVEITVFFGKLASLEGCLFVVVEPLDQLL